MCEHYDRRHGGTYRRLIGVCFLYRGTNHFIKGYPRGQPVPQYRQRGLCHQGLGVEVEVDVRLPIH